MKYQPVLGRQKRVDLELLNGGTHVCVRAHKMFTTTIILSTRNSKMKFWMFKGQGHGTARRLAKKEQAKPLCILIAVFRYAPL